MRERITCPSQQQQQQHPHPLLCHTVHQQQPEQQRQVPLHARLVHLSHPTTANQPPTHNDNNFFNNRTTTITATTAITKTTASTTRTTTTRTSTITTGCEFRIYYKCNSEALKHVGSLNSTMTFSDHMKNKQSIWLYSSSVWTPDHSEVGGLVAEQCSNAVFKVSHDLTRPTIVMIALKAFKKVNSKTTSSDEFGVTKNIIGSNNFPVVSADFVVVLPFAPAAIFGNVGGSCLTITRIDSASSRRKIVGKYFNFLLGLMKLWKQLGFLNTLNSALLRNSNSGRAVIEPRKEQV
uniref:Uncharacterized protein n=1 Tax=Glossina palpalis gambiensis TaxID=67801 RepID=A0A1B0BZF4_9MUSC